MTSSKKLRSKMTEIYNRNIWGNEESRSGNGSSYEAARHFANALEIFIEENSINTIIDAPCGDANWISSWNFFGCEYLGIDIVEGLIRENNATFASDKVRFACQDIRKHKIPRADLLIVRDLLVHLSLKDGKKVLRQISKSGSKYVALTTFQNVELNKELNFNPDPAVLSWRPINMSLAPYNLGNVILSIDERCVERDGDRIYNDKRLNIYQISSWKI